MPSPTDPRPPVGPAAPEADPRSVPDASRFRFDGVQLVGGPIHLPDDPDGFAVVFDGQGIEVTGVEAGDRLQWSWGDVDTVSVGSVAVGPDGREATPVDVVSASGTVRLLVGADRSGSVQFAALEQWLAGLRSVTPGTTPTGADDSVLDAVIPPSFAAAGAPGAPGAAPPPPPAPAAAPPPPQWPAPQWTPPGPGAPRSGPAVGGPPPGFLTPMPRVHPGQTGPHRAGRRRRWVMLVGGLVLIVVGVGLAVGLSRRPGPAPAAAPTTPSPLAPDQRMAKALMLTQSDLPQGWRVDTVGDQGGSSPKLRSGEARITRTFASCMGITAGQAGVVLGGQGGDQTARASSPVFVGPASASQPGFFTELQTAASIVRTHGDEESNFSLFSRPRYLGCAARAVASELQLGENEASGTNGRPGPTSVAPVTLPAPSGEQVSGLLVTFSISDQANSVPVEVELVTLGSDRIEADLEAFAIGGRIPTGVVSASVARFEERVAVGGRIAQA